MNACTGQEYGRYSWWFILCLGNGLNIFSDFLDLFHHVLYIIGLIHKSKAVLKDSFTNKNSLLF